MSWSEKLLNEYNEWGEWCECHEAEDFTGFKTEKMRAADSKSTVNCPIGKR